MQKVFFVVLDEPQSLDICVTALKTLASV